MMTGTVNSQLEAVVEVFVLGPSGKTKSLAAVVDTGFDGWLTLPQDVISELDFNWRGRGRALLADGAETIFDRYDAILTWHGLARRIMVDSANIKPLLGMSLLQNCKLRMQVRSGGPVTIEPLPKLS